MARAIFIFVLAALIAGFVVWVVSFPGWVTADWFGYRYEAPMSLTVLILFALFVAIYFVLRFIRAIAAGPAAGRRYFEHRRAERGMGALTQGLAAAAAGDASLAHRQAARAGRLVKDGPLAQVLALEAATLEERDDDVAALAPGLLSHPETELLGRRALFDLARKKRDRTAEVNQAEAAFGTHPAAGWAAEALLADAISAKDWDRARSVLTRAARHDAFANGRGEKIRAALLLAEAKDLAGTGEAAKAAGLTRKAWDTGAGLAAAAVMRAEQLDAAGKPKAAREFVTRTWGTYPHPKLGRIFAERGADETQEDCAKRVRDLVSTNSAHLESRLLVAEQAILARDVVGARSVLKSILEAGNSARAFALMAALERVEHGAAAQPDDWMAAALAAPRDAVWICNVCGHRETDWHATCARCASIATAEWATHIQDAGDAPAAADEQPPAVPTPLPAQSPPRESVQEEPMDPATPEDVPPSVSPDALRQPDDPGAGEMKSPDGKREW
jgi:HemY protein